MSDRKSCMNASSKPYKKTFFSVCGACRGNNIIVTRDTACTVSLFFIAGLFVATIILRIGAIAAIITQMNSIRKAPVGINGSFA